MVSDVPVLEGTASCVLYQVASLGKPSDEFALITTPYRVLVNNYGVHRGYLALAGRS
jgi:hypothetical protein